MLVCLNEVCLRRSETGLCIDQGDVLREPEQWHRFDSAAVLIGDGRGQGRVGACCDDEHAVFQRLLEGLFSASCVCECSNARDATSMNNPQSNQIQAIFSPVICVSRCLC